MLASDDVGLAAVVPAMVMPGVSEVSAAGDFSKRVRLTRKNILLLLFMGSAPNPFVCRRVQVAGRTNKGLDVCVPCTFGG